MAVQWSRGEGESEAIELTERVSVDLESFLASDKRRFEVTILDMSRSDVRLQTPEPLIVGETMELQLGWSGHVMVRIIWSEAGEAGAAYVDLQ